MSSDGEGDMVAPSSDGARRAIELALRHAGLTPADIDYINTHGTSTPAGDVAEVRAIRAVFGDRHVAYSSTKGYTGHMRRPGRSKRFTLAMLRGGWLAPGHQRAAARPELEAYPPVLAHGASAPPRARTRSPAAPVTLVLSSLEQRTKHLGAMRQVPLSVVLIRPLIPRRAPPTSPRRPAGVAVVFEPTLASRAWPAVAARPVNKADLDGGTGRQDQLAVGSLHLLPRRPTCCLRPWRPRSNGGHVDRRSRPRRAQTPEAAAELLKRAFFHPTDAAGTVAAPTHN
jgi:hypothetical protein